MLTKYAEGALYAEVARLPGGEPSLLGLTVDHEWRLLREFKRQTEEGGDAKVWASRYPAQFFRLTAGDVEITTGSGIEMGVLILHLAEAIATGMVGFETLKAEKG